MECYQTQAKLHDLVSENLSPTQLSQYKAPKPGSDLVKFTLQAVLILLGEKDVDWLTVNTKLRSPDAFYSKLVDYDLSRLEY